MNKISFFALGGLDEKGKNCFVLEIDDALFIFDAGIITPSFSKFGVKKIMFDYTWLQTNLPRVKGLFIGIANMLSIGSLQFLNGIFKNIPIYTSRVNKLVINSFFNERSMQNVRDFVPYNIVEVNPLVPFKVANIEFTAFKITAINPEAIGFCVKTSQGYITVIDEFIISPETSLAFQSQVDKINSITNHDNLLLITAAGNVSDGKGFTSPNHDPTSFLTKIIRKTKGRLVIGMFDENIYQLIKIVDICTKYSVPMLVNNGVTVALLKKFEELKIIKPNPLILNVKQSDSMKKGVVLVVGGQDKMFGLITQILDGQNKVITPQEGDEYILAIKTQPGYEFIEAQTYDKISYLGYSWMKFPKTIAPLKPSLNDHLFLITMLKPKYIIPVKGLHFHFSEYIIGAKPFFDSNKILSLDNGFKVWFDKGHLVKNRPEFMNVQEKFIGSYGLNSVEDVILNERKLMSENGVVLIHAVIKRENNKNEIIDFEIEGFGITIQSEDANEAYELMLKLIREQIITNFGSKVILNKDLKNNIKKISAKYFNKNFGKTPIILPIIIEINSKNKN